MGIMNLYVCIRKHVCSCFTCHFWDWEWLCHSIYLPNQGLIRRIDSIYNHSPLSLLNHQDCVFTRSPYWVWGLIYIYGYMNFWETTFLYTLLDLCFLRETEFFMTLLLFIHFGFSSSWKWHVCYILCKCFVCY